MDYNIKNDKIIDISLIEYQELQNERKEMISRQFLVISLTLTLLGTFLGFGMPNISNETTTNTLDIVPLFLFYIMIPGISSFFCALWIDSTYCTVKLESHILKIEHVIKENLIKCSDEKLLKNFLFTRQYSIHEFGTRSVNNCLFYVGLISYIFIPCISVAYAICVYSLHWFVLASAFALLPLIWTILVYYSKIKKQSNLVKCEAWEEIK